MFDTVTHRHHIIFKVISFKVDAQLQIVGIFQYFDNEYVCEVSLLKDTELLWRAKRAIENWLWWDWWGKWKVAADVKYIWWLPDSWQPNVNTSSSSCWEVLLNRSWHGAQVCQVLRNCGTQLFNGMRCINIRESQFEILMGWNQNGVHGRAFDIKKVLRGKA